MRTTTTATVTIAVTTGNFHSNQSIVTDDASMAKTMFALK
jgi:hypothetical protein